MWQKTPISEQGDMYIRLSLKTKEVWQRRGWGAMLNVECLIYNRVHFFKWAHINEYKNETTKNLHPIYIVADGFGSSGLRAYFKKYVHAFQPQC